MLLSACNPATDPVSPQQPAEEISEAAPLPSWNRGPARKAIMDFVARVTSADSAEYVTESERIAVFDKVELEYRNGEPVLIRQPEIDFIDDKEGKPVGIHKFIGRRPIAAFGNSDGDLHMLQWTTAGSGARLGVLIRHTDAEREWPYDRESHIGRLDAALDAAGEKNWVVVDMKHDWKTVYPATSN